jgi:C4-dicarboxylate-specific signal transduction histidine kinase
VQVFINILDNAVDAILDMPEKMDEKIIIETSTRMWNGANYVYIGIFNSGKPIQQVLINHLFDPFFTTKAPNKGTGLGLYISYNIIKDHKGIIEVDNIEGGVLFKIYLPY